MSLRVLNLLVSFLKKQVSTYLRKEIKLRTKSNGCGIHYLHENAIFHGTSICNNFTSNLKKKQKKKTLRELMFNIFLVRLPNIYFFYIFVFCGFAKLSSSLPLLLSL